MSWLKIRFYWKIVAWSGEKINKNTLVDSVVIIAFALFVIFAFRDIFNRGMLAYGDMSPFPERASDAIKLFSSSWVPLSHGLTSQWLDAVLIFRAFLIIISGGNAALAQKIYLIFPFVMAFLGMRIFLGLYIKSNIARYIASFIYSVNPMTLASPILGGATGLLYIHAFLPLIIYSLFNLTFKYRKGKSRARHILLFSIFFAFSFGFGMHGALFVSPFLLYCLLKIIASRNRKIIVESFKALTVAFCLFFLLILPAFAPTLQYMLPYLIPGGLTSPGYGIVSPSLGISYGLPFPPFDIITLQTVGILGWGTNISGLALPLLAFSSLLAKKKDDRARAELNLFFAFLAISIISFIYLANLGKITWLFNTFRLLVVLPNADVPSLLLAFAYSAMIGTTIDQVERKTRQFQRKLDMFIENHKIGLLYSIRNSAFASPRRVAFIILCFVIIVNSLNFSWTFLRGDMGLYLVRSENMTHIPAEFYEISSWLKERKGDEVARTLWVPSSYTGIEIKIRYLDMDFLDTPYGLERWFTLDLSYYQYTVLKEVFEKQNSRVLGALLAPLNVKYIVVHLASMDKGKPTVQFNGDLVGDPIKITEILNYQKDIKLVANTSKYLIYENLAYIAHLAAFSGGFYINSSSSIDSSEVIRLLSTIPNFEISNQLLVFKDKNNSSPEEKAFLDGLNSLLVLRGENFISPEQIETRSVFYIPKSGYYKILYPWPGYQNLLIDVDGNITDNRRVGESRWFESETVKFNQGSHKIEISHPQRKPEGLVAWWLPDVSSIDSLHDVSGYGNNGTIHGATLTIEELGKALLFDGNDYIEVPFSENLKITNNYAIEVWLNPADLAMTKTIIDNAHGGDLPGYIFRIHYSDLEVHIFYGLRIEAYVLKDVITEGWQHIALTFDANFIRFFRNGEMISEFALEADPLPASDQPLIIGKRYSTSIPQPFEGLMGEIKIYNRTLTPEEIKIDYEERIMEEKIPDRILIFETEKSSSSLQEMLAKDYRIDVHASQRGFTEYYVEVNESRQFFIFFGEPYHDSWNAYLPSGEKLNHFPAFYYMNGYFFEKNGATNTRIAFDEQKTRNLYIYIWATSWSTLLILTIVAYVLPSKIRKKIRKSLFNR